VGTLGKWEKPTKRISVGRETNRLPQAHSGKKIGGEDDPLVGGGSTKPGGPCTELGADLKTRCKKKRANSAKGCRASGAPP